MTTATADTPEAPASFDTLGFIIAFEAGELDEDAILAGFQHLVDTGLAWQLQGSYGRFASALISQGLISNRRASS